LSNIIIAVLVVPPVISLGFQEWAQAGFILLVILLNVVIGVAQEGKAERATQAIKGMMSVTAMVLRDSKKVESGCK